MYLHSVKPGSVNTNLLYLQELKKDDMKSFSIFATLWRVFNVLKIQQCEQMPVHKFKLRPCIGC